MNQFFTPHSLQSQSLLGLVGSSIDSVGSSLLGGILGSVGSIRGSVLGSIDGIASSILGSVNSIACSIYNVGSCIGSCVTGILERAHQTIDNRLGGSFGQGAHGSLDGGVLTGEGLDLLGILLQEVLHLLHVLLSSLGVGLQNLGHLGLNSLKNLLQLVGVLSLNLLRELGRDLTEGSLDVDSLYSVLNYLGSRLLSLVSTRSETDGHSSHHHEHDFLHNCFLLF